MMANHTVLDFGLPTREKRVLPISILHHKGKGELNWWAILFDPRVITQEGGSPKEPHFSPPGVSNSSERILIGEPCCSTLELICKREVS